MSANPRTTRSQDAQAGGDLRSAPSASEDATKTAVSAARPNSQPARKARPVGRGRGVCNTSTAGMIDSGETATTSASGIRVASTEPQLPVTGCIFALVADVWCARTDGSANVSVAGSNCAAPQRARFSPASLRRRVKLRRASAGSFLARIVAPQRPSRYPVRDGFAIGPVGNRVGHQPPPVALLTYAPAGQPPLHDLVQLQTVGVIPP